eukprot:GILK01002849.1.p1 GENE.GILK01002849.1~~GILK01002849.1.p1  ORF type:complete len:581 (-),score=94.60 GILK01002849.1:385-2085(-)
MAVKANRVALAPKVVPSERALHSLWKDRCKIEDQAALKHLRRTIANLDESFESGEYVTTRASPSPFFSHTYTSLSSEDSFQTTYSSFHNISLPDHVAPDTNLNTSNLTAPFALYPSNLTEKTITDGTSSLGRNTLGFSNENEKSQSQMDTLWARRARTPVDPLVVEDSNNGDLDDLDPLTSSPAGPSQSDYQHEAIRRPYTTQSNSHSNGNSMYAASDMGRVQPHATGSISKNSVISMEEVRAILNGTTLEPPSTASTGLARSERRRKTKTVARSSEVESVQDVKIAGSQRSVSPSSSVMSRLNRLASSQRLGMSVDSMQKPLNPTGQWDSPIPKACASSQIGLESFSPAARLHTQTLSLFDKSPKSANLQRPGTALSSFTSVTSKTGSSKRSTGSKGSTLSRSSSHSSVRLKPVTPSPKSAKSPFKLPSMIRNPSSPSLNRNPSSVSMFEAEQRSPLSATNHLSRSQVNSYPSPIQRDAMIESWLSSKRPATGKSNTLQPLSPSHHPHADILVLDQDVYEDGFSTRSSKLSSKIRELEEELLREREARVNAESILHAVLPSLTAT